MQEQLILDAAETLIRTRGYFGLNFEDVATSTGVEATQITALYACEAQMALAVIHRTRSAIEQGLAEVRNQPPRALLTSYFAAFEQALDDEVGCLCGMLMAAGDAIPAEVKRANDNFIQWQIAWLTDVLAAGADDGSLHLTGEPSLEATQIYATLQGSLALARTHDKAGFQSNLENIWRRLVEE